LRFFFNKKTPTFSIKEIKCHFQTLLLFVVVFLMKEQDFKFDIFLKKTFKSKIIGEIF
jgi:hypothetical protein